MMTTDRSGATAAMLALSGASLDELELLSGGLFAPADGYCLPSAVPINWPAPFSLKVPPQVGHEAVAQAGLLLTDPDGTPLARLDVESSHVSVDGESVYLAGPLTRLRSAEHPPVRRLRITEPLHLSDQAHSPLVVAVFSETPRPWQLAAAMTTAFQTNSQLWLVALSGPQPHGRYTVLSLLHELESAALRIDGAKAGLVVLPADPREASRRDHVLQKHVLRSLGANQVLDYTVANGMPAEVHEAANLLSPTGTVVFLTGLSGSGKSTVARALAEEIQQDTAVPLTLLDGDDVRRILSPGLGFSKADREANIQRIGWVASLVSATGGIAVCAPIAPFDATRKQVRNMAERVGGFLLVHISTPLPVCESRDRKGLYAKARRGEVKDFTGIDSPYEYPYDADLHLDTSELSIAEAVARIRSCLVDAGTLKPSPVRSASQHF